MGEMLRFQNEDSLKKYFKDFAKKLQPGDVVALYGTLGAGKTTIAREMIKSLCGEDIIVTSPTFNLLQTYDTADCTIYHFDLYRLSNASEVYELGIEEALDSHISIIEWPEIFEKNLPKNTIKIKIDIIDNADRLCIIT